MAVGKWERMMSKKARSKAAGKRPTKVQKNLEAVPAPTPEPTPVCVPAPAPAPAPEPTPTPVSEEEAQIPRKSSVIDWIKRKWWAFRIYGQL
jgi:hypothetical protein